MKHMLIAVAGLLGTFATSTQAELTWLTDFEEGQKAAAESGKTLLVDFTGSDWCHWCVKLKEEVFTQEAFQAAGEKFVLVELDFPQDETLVTPEQRAKNEALAEKFGVQGFPSVILFDAQARPFARTGYQAGGPDSYLNHLSDISAPYQALKEAKEDSRKEALATFLKTLSDEAIEEHFAKEFEELKKLDPEDETGLLAELALAKASAEFESTVQEHLSKGDFDLVLATTDAFIAEHKPEGEKLQHAMMAKVMVAVEKGDSETAFAIIDEMKDLAPDSEFSQNVDQIKQNITDHLKARREMEANAEEASDEELAEPGEPEAAEAVDNTAPAPAGKEKKPEVR